MRIISIILLSVFCMSCFKRKSLPADSETFKPSRRLAQLTNKKLEEVSGLACSAANPGQFWTLNDSGNPAVVYLIDQNLDIKLSCKLKGLKNRDWEDIAVGPGPEKDKKYVYVADIGDNNAKHEVKYIYRFVEPVATDAEDEVIISDFDTIAFQLEDGKKDTEAILIHPKTKNIYVVSKREEPVHVYELTLPSSKTADILTAKKIASLALTRIVAGGFSPDGDEIVMKNYDNLFYWNVAGKSLTKALETPPAILNYTEEPQGEALAFNLDGSGFYTLSEMVKGEKTYLYFYERNN